MKSSSFRSVNGCPALSTALTFRLTRRVSMRMVSFPGNFDFTSVTAGAAVTEELSTFTSVGRAGLFSSLAEALNVGLGFASAALTSAVWTGDAVRNGSMPEGLPEGLDAARRDWRFIVTAPGLLPRIDLP